MTQNTAGNLVVADYAEELVQLLLADPSLPFALVIELPNGQQPVPITIGSRHLTHGDVSQLLFRAGVIESLVD